MEVVSPVVEPAPLLQRMVLVRLRDLAALQKLLQVEPELLLGQVSLVHIADCSDLSDELIEFCLRTRHLLRAVESLDVLELLVQLIESTLLLGVVRAREVSCVIEVCLGCLERIRRLSHLGGVVVSVHVRLEARVIQERLARVESGLLWRGVGAANLCKLGQHLSGHDLLGLKVRRLVVMVIRSKRVHHGTETRLSRLQVLARRIASGLALASCIVGSEHGGHRRHHHVNAAIAQRSCRWVLVQRGELRLIGASTEAF